MTSEFIVKVRAKDIDTLGRILQDALEEKGISCFYILTEDGKSLAHLHKDSHLWVERAESDAFAETAKGLESRIESAFKNAKIVVRGEP
jgi:hypothetical protein